MSPAAADERQATRLGRFLMAAGTSVLVCLTLVFCAAMGFLPWRAAIEGSALIGALILAFYALFRSGLNLRFSDPSLTTEQAGAALLTLAYIMYHAGPAREALALVALAAHATMLMLVLIRDPQMDAVAAITEFVVLMVVLPWFAAMGGYVNGLRVRLGESNRELQAAYERIEGLAMRDELTGAYNRRYLMEVLARESARAQRLGRPLTLCLLDVDHFKSVNDTLGHAAGDAVLRKLPEILAAGTRGGDVVGRFGGEEFLLVLPDTDINGAARSRSAPARPWRRPTSRACPRGAASP